VNFNESFDNSPNSIFSVSSSSREKTSFETFGKNTDSAGKTIVQNYYIEGERYQSTQVIQFLPNQVLRSAYENGEEAQLRTGDYITKLSISKNGVALADWSNTQIYWTDYLRFEGSRRHELQFKRDDQIIGTNTDDTIWGYAGNDTIDGGKGNDSIDGGDGDDILIGGPGNDHLNGGWGKNFVYGGSGYDIVYLRDSVRDYALSKNPTTEYIHIFSKLGENLGFIDDKVEALSFIGRELYESKNIAYVGKTSILSINTELPVHRFYNNRDKAFFYTSDLAEKKYVEKMSTNQLPADTEWPYVYQGVTFSIARSYNSSYGNIKPVKEFYNEKTGHHFYTASDAESSFINEKINSDNWPFKFTGNAFDVYPEDPTPGFQGKEVAVYRFYNPSLDRHFFTANLEEKTLITITGVWNYEGVAFYGEAV
jgi:hypothetical protein